MVLFLARIDTYPQCFFFYSQNNRVRLHRTTPSLVGGYCVYYVVLRIVHAITYIHTITSIFQSCVALMGTMQELTARLSIWPVAGFTEVTFTTQAPHMPSRHIVFVPGSCWCWRRKSASVVVDVTSLGTASSLLARLDTEIRRFEPV